MYICMLNGEIVKAVVGERRGGIRKPIVEPLSLKRLFPLKCGFGDLAEC